MARPSDLRDPCEYALGCMKHDSERTCNIKPAVSEIAALSQRGVSECLSFEPLLTLIPLLSGCLQQEVAFKTHRSIRAFTIDVARCLRLVRGENSGARACLGRM